MINDDRNAIRRQQKHDEDLKAISPKLFYSKQLRKAKPFFGAIQLYISSQISVKINMSGSWYLNDVPGLG